MKVKLTKKQQELFDNNFDKDAYEMALQPIRDILSKPNDFMGLWNALRDYDGRDIDCTDDYDILYCEVELDRSNMRTTADYVGIDVAIFLDEETGRNWIGGTALYTSDTDNGEVTCICLVDPNTCEVIKWCQNGIGYR